MIVVDGDEGEVALELADGGAHGGGQVALVVALNEVGDRLGVGLGAEAWPSASSASLSSR